MAKPYCPLTPPWPAAGMTFNVTLKTAGSQTITATDTTVTSPAIIGNSNPITTRGLVVTSFTPLPTGFMATFNKPLNPSDVALYAGGRSISSLTVSGTTATVTTASAHGFVVGQTIVISGTSITSYNGPVTVLSVPSSTTFTYAVPSNLGSSSGGEATTVQDDVILTGATTGKVAGSLMIDPSNMSITFTAATQFCWSDQ